MTLKQANARAATSEIDSAPEDSDYRLQLLEVPCPYEANIHSGASQLQSTTLDWARAIGLVDDQNVRKLDQQKIGYFLALVFPQTTDLEALQLAADWTTLFCLLDNRLEAFKKAWQVANYLNKLRRVFHKGEDPSLEDPISQAFADLRQRINKVEMKEWRNKFSIAIEQLFDAFVREAFYRMVRLTPDFNAYRSNRRYTVGIKTGFILGELIHRDFLPLLPKDKTIVFLENLACNIVGTANDICTARQEQKSNEVNNLILVFVDLGVSFEEAMDKAIQIHNAEVFLFLKQAEKLVRKDPSLKVYVDVLTAFIYAHGRWAGETERYQCANDTVV